jgi:hypothetical protein
MDGRSTLSCSLRPATISSKPAQLPAELARGPLTATKLIGKTALRRGAAVGRELSVVVSPLSSIPSTPRPGP